MKTPNKETFDIKYFLKKDRWFIFAWWKWYENMEWKDVVVWDYQYVGTEEEWMKVLKEYGYKEWDDLMK